jgi:hypothetical protein
MIAKAEVADAAYLAEHGHGPIDKESEEYAMQEYLYGHYGPKRRLTEAEKEGLKRNKAEYLADDGEWRAA